MEVGKRIKDLREERGMTVNKLAYMSGISQSYLRDVELGIKDNPSVNVLESICDALNISLSDFFNTKGNVVSLNPALLSEIAKLSPSQQDALQKLLSSIF